MGWRLVSRSRQDITVEIARRLDTQIILFGDPGKGEKYGATGFLRVLLPEPQSGLDNRLVGLQQTASDLARRPLDQLHRRLALTGNLVAADAVCEARTRHVDEQIEV